MGSGEGTSELSLYSGGRGATIIGEWKKRMSKAWKSVKWKTHGYLFTTYLVHLLRPHSIEMEKEGKALRILELSWGKS